MDQAGVHVEVVAGRLDVLRFRCPDHVDHIDGLGRIATAIDAAVLTEPRSTSEPPEESDPDRDVVMAFVSAQRERARAFAPAGRKAWQIGRADGRDASGRIHVSVDAEHVVLLDVPPDLLADARRAAAGIIEAYNQARDRQADDARAQADLVGTDDVDELEAVSWRDLRQQVDAFAGR